MSTLRTCPACATNFIRGRKALVLGAMRLVCLSCSEGAMRMVTTVKNAKCQEKHCNERSVYCSTHLDKRIREAVAKGTKPVKDVLLAMIRGMRNVVPKDADKEGFEHAQGKLEGLESALEVILELERRA
jgi:hypothetical protein